MKSVTIAARFNGPPGMGNGGYVAGRLAEALGFRGGEVTLHRPCPLDHPLDVEHTEMGGALRAGDEVIASLRVGELPDHRWGRPDPVAVAQARGQFRAVNPFPTCFVCGHDRPSGLFVEPGLVGDAMVAAPWRPSAAIARPDGTVPASFVWAVLDCPTGFAALLDGPPLPAVLGRFSVQVEHPVHVGEQYVVSARGTGADGRKRTAEAALWSSEGVVVARSRSTWVLPRVVADMGAQMHGA